jgi:hypothetical protein
MLSASTIRNAGTRRSVSRARSRAKLFEDKVAALDQSVIEEALVKGNSLGILGRWCRCLTAEKPDDDRRLLRPRRVRPHNRRTANKCDEFASMHLRPSGMFCAVRRDEHASSRRGIRCCALTELADCLPPIRAPTTSAPPRQPDIRGADWHVSNVADPKFSLRLSLWRPKI